MLTGRKGISLIALIITIAIIVIIAGVTLTNGLQRSDEAKFAKHNTNISVMQEDVESYYYYKDGELPITNLTPYPITSSATLYAEITKNAEESDEFYILDLAKLGKIVGKDGTGDSDDIYIVSSKKHNIYYVKGTIVKGLVYHGLAIKNSGSVAQGTISTPTVTANSTPVNTPTSTSTPTPTLAYSYENPKIPIGFTKVGDETWNNGFTIQDLYQNQFVWVPALAPSVKANGTLDGITFTSKFGRRNFRADTFGASAFYETNDANLHNITTSVNTYGGFYIAKYEVSNNSDRAQSKADVTPWTDINWSNSKIKAESMDTDWGWNTSYVESYLCYSANWDTALQWLIDSGAKSPSEVKDDSATWGNYYNSTFTYGAGITKAINVGTKINTGVDTDLINRNAAGGIYDLAANVWEWTMENYTGSYRAYRGGDYFNHGNVAPAAHRYYTDPANATMSIGFRSVLCIY